MDVDTAAPLPSTEASPSQSGSPLDLDGAAALLTNLNKQPRDEPTGRFAEKKADALAADQNKVVELKTKEQVAEVEDDDEWLEWAADKDGEAPKREKLSAIVEAWERVPTLEKELADLRESRSETPAEYAAGLQQIAQQRAQYINAVKQLSTVLAGAQPPSLELLNLASQHYNPEAYYAEQLRYEADTRRAAAARSEIEAREKEQADYQEWETRQNLARQMQAISKEWPEFLKDESVRKEARGVLKDYGFTEDEITAIGDARYMRVVKDAMAFRKIKAEQAEAVNHVRAKPKLVRGQARTNMKDTARSSAISRLQQTGHVDDAVAAIRGIF